ncbi:type I 3-dehydroquinate dehydratase [Leptospira sp. WS92.C1]
MSRSDFQIVLTLSENEFFSLKEHPPCDWIEIRLDLFSPDSLKEKLSNQIEFLNTKCIFTYRQAGDTDQTASFKESELDFHKFVNLIKPKKHYLDLELNRSNDLLETHATQGFGLIRSVHKFNGILSEEEIRDWIRKDPYLDGRKKYDSALPLVYKFAVFPTSTDELTRFLTSIRKIAKEYRNLKILLTGICMGPMGVISRVFPEAFGSFFTYCCLKEPKAPGQIDLYSLIRLKDRD